jgi:F-type H+-transporting ATPase subunit delta
MRVGVGLMEEIARVYADALFRAAKEEGKLDQVREQLAEIADALESNRELQVFFFSPYFSSAEKRDGISRAISGAEAELVSFLELLNEKHRMPVIFRIQRRFEEMWARENRRLAVTVTSAVDLDPGISERIGEELESQTGQKVELRNRVDGEILGGLVLQVGNMVLDASIRNRLEKLRKNVAAAA